MNVHEAACRLSSVWVSRVPFSLFKPHVSGKMHGLTYLTVQEFD